MKDANKGLPARLLVVVGFIVAVLVAVRVVWLRLSAAPRLELSATQIDLGTGKPDETLTGSFVLRNAGRKPLTYQISKSCGCTSLDPRSGVLNAREEVSVSVGVKLGSHSGASKSLRLAIRSNDPRRPEATCRLLANCPAELRPSPRSVNFGATLQGDAPPSPQSVHLTSDVSGCVVNPERLEVISPPSFLRLKSVAVKRVMEWICMSLFGPFAN